MFWPVQKVLAACEPGSGADGTNLIECFPLGNNQQAVDVYNSPAVLVNLFVNLLFLGAGLLIFVWILYSAFKMISGKKKGFDEAKSTLTNAAIGLIVMVAAYWIVQLVATLTGLNLRVGLP